jgi:hypothetical protein
VGRRAAGAVAGADRPESLKSLEGIASLDLDDSSYYRLGYSDEPFVVNFVLCFLLAVRLMSLGSQRVL